MFVTDNVQDTKLLKICPFSMQNGSVIFYTTGPGLLETNNTLKIWLMLLQKPELIKTKLSFEAVKIGRKRGNIV